MGGAPRGGRVGRVTFAASSTEPRRIVVACERLPELRIIHPPLVVEPRLHPPPSRPCSTCSASPAKAAWGRLSPAQADTPASGLALTAPIALSRREHGSAWRALRPTDGEPPLGEPARTVLSTLRARGASFCADLAAATGFDAAIICLAIDPTESRLLACEIGLLPAIGAKGAAVGRGSRISAVRRDQITGTPSTRGEAAGKPRS